MNFDEYSELAWKTAIFPNRGSDLSYPTLGLTGEAGEIAEKVKKLIRDSNGEITDEFLAAMKKELGDVLWYLNALTRTCGFTLEEIAVANVEKLYGRIERGTLHGSGDDR